MATTVHLLFIRPPSTRVPHFQGVQPSIFSIYDAVVSPTGSTRRPSSLEPPPPVVGAVFHSCTSGPQTSPPSTRSSTSYRRSCQTAHSPNSPLSSSPPPPPPPAGTSSMQTIHRLTEIPPTSRRSALPGSTRKRGKTFLGHRRPARRFAQERCLAGDKRWLLVVDLFQSSESEWSPANDAW